VVVKKSTREGDGRHESRALVASSLGNCRAQRLDCRGELAAPVRVSRDMTIHLRLGAVEQGLGLRGFGARLVDVTVGLGEQAVETQQPEIAKMDQPAQVGRLRQRVEDAIGPLRRPHHLVAPDAASTILFSAIDAGMLDIVRLAASGISMERMWL
jgi:hypothetical protein